MKINKLKFATFAGNNKFPYKYISLLQCFYFYRAFDIVFMHWKINNSNFNA